MSFIIFGSTLIHGVTHYYIPKWYSTAGQYGMEDITTPQTAEKEVKESEERMSQ